MDRRRSSDPELTHRLSEAWEAVRQHDVERARALADTLLRDAPGRAEAVGGRSGILWALGERDLAVTEATRALSLDSEEGAAHMVLAEVALSARRLKEAVSHLRSAYSQARSAHRGRLLVRALREQGDLDEAARVWSELRARYPGDAPVAREGALLAEAQGRLEEAESLWEGLLEDVQEGPFARARLMALRARQESPESAAAQLRRAAELRGRSDPRAGMRLLLEAAEAERTQGNLAGAVEGYRRYLTEQPGDTYAMRQLAFALRRTGAAEEARPLLEALLRRDPDDAYVRSALLTDALRTDPEKGLNFFRTLVREHPESTALYAAIRRLTGGLGGGSRRKSAGGRKPRESGHGGAAAEASAAGPVRPDANQALSNPALPREASVGETEKHEAARRARGSKHPGVRSTRVGGNGDRLPSPDAQVEQGPGPGSRQTTLHVDPPEREAKSP